MPPARRKAEELQANFEQRKRKVEELRVHSEGDSFLHFCRFKLEKHDPSILKLLDEFVAVAQTCVFCKTSFDLANPGTCEICHENEDDDAADIRCVTCGSEINDGVCLGDDLDHSSSKICYAGPHRSSYPDGHHPREEWSDAEELIAAGHHPREEQSDAKKKRERERESERESLRERR